MKHYINFIYALLALVLFACSSANEEQEPVVTPPKGDEPAVTPPTTPASTKWTFSYTLPAKDSEETRAAGSAIQFDELDARNRVGLFCVKKSDNSLYSNFNNLRYKPSDNGTLEQDSIPTPDKPKDECKIIAYAPYSTDFNGFPNDNITFSVPKDQTSDENLIVSDLLWCETDADAMTDNVDITFKRILPRWVLTITIADGLKPEDFNNAVFAIYNVKRQIGFNVQTGKTDGNPTGKSAVLKFLNIDKDNKDSKFVGTVILPPQQADACYLRVVFNDGVTYFFKFVPFAFKEGKRYYSNIKLVGFPNDLRAEIKSWEENNINGTITSETE